MLCVLCASVLFSCTTVKEQRIDCPCILNIGLDAYTKYDDCESVSVRVLGDTAFQSTVNPLDYAGHGYDVEVKRRTNRVTVISGLEKSVMEGDSLYFPKGVEADPLRVFTAMVPCEDDLASVTAVPYKKWCDVHVILMSVIPGEEFPYDILLSADCNGLRLSTGQPTWGDYRVLVNRTKVGEPVVRLPRQKESSVRLDFYDRNEAREYSLSDRVFSMDIGPLMDRQGYDWSKDNLDDIYVFVDHTRMTATVNVSEWNRETIIEEI